MRLAFALFKYSPYGGLQRDFMAVARRCQQRGHSVRVYSWSWDGELPAGFERVAVPVSALSNHRRQQQFAEFVQQHLAANPVDCVVGYNRLPGLDLYFAADNCYAAKSAGRGALHRLSPRYRHFSAFERAVFDPAAHTRILTIAPRQRDDFQRHYATPGERFVALPPGIPRDRVAGADAAERRNAKRRELGLADDDLLLLALGSGFATKGLDRSLRALAALPEPLRHRCRLHVVGNDRPARYQRLARKLGIAEQVQFLGGRDDVPDYLLAADLLLHPARSEAGGMALLEAAVAGLPVLASAVCGFASYIADYGCGQLLAEPFDQQRYNRQLAEMLESPQREQWAAGGLRMAREADIFDQVEQVVAEIENWGERSGEAGGGDPGRAAR